MDVQGGKKSYCKYFSFKDEGEVWFMEKDDSVEKDSY